MTSAHWGEKPNGLGTWSKRPPRGDKGRNRHALVNADGRGGAPESHVAAIQDSAGLGPLPQAARRCFAAREGVRANGDSAAARVSAAARAAAEFADPIGLVAFSSRRRFVDCVSAAMDRKRRSAKGFAAADVSARAFLFAALRDGGRTEVRMSSASFGAGA